MESLNVKAKNTVEEINGKVKLVYIPKQGILAQDKKGNKLAFFQFGKDINNYLNITHEYLKRDPEIQGSTDAYSFFNEGFAFWVSQRNRNILNRMRCDTSFIFKGYELIGMEYEKFLHLKLLSPNFVQYDYDFVCSNFSRNFRHYTLYYFCKYELILYVWRKKIRLVFIKHPFFRNRYNKKYLEMFNIQRL